MPIPVPCGLPSVLLSNRYPCRLSLFRRQLNSVPLIFHTVQAGENHESIAKKYDVTLENILDVNDLTTEVIHKGDKLFIPGARLDSVALREAMGETIVRLRAGGKVYAGRGLSTDIIRSSIRAYINALNKIAYEESQR